MQKGSRGVREICSDYIPTPGMQELDHMRPNKSLRAGYQCDLFHWNCKVTVGDTLQPKIHSFQPAVPTRSGPFREFLFSIEDFTHVTEQHLPLTIPCVL